MYHISFEDLGEEVIFKPRIPYTNGESKIKRICVSPTPFHCFIAIPTKLKDFFVYKVNDNITYHEPDGFVLDRDVTEEKWILEPCKFKRVGKFSKELSKKFFLEYVGAQETIEDQYYVLDSFFRNKSKFLNKFYSGEKLDF